MSRVLHGIHLSDTHLGPTPDFLVRGAHPLARLEQLLRTLDRLDFEPDFIIHTGDVADSPNRETYALAARAFAPLAGRSPLYAVAGNHDSAAMLRSDFPMGPLRHLTGEPGRLVYRFDLPGLRGYVLDANLERSDEPHGLLPEEQLSMLERELAGDDTPFAIFLHFQPFGIDSSWIDAHLPLRNGEALHRLLRDQPVSRVRGVFFGHLHRSVQIYRDGILYSGAPSPVCEFSAGAHDDRIGWEADCPVQFQHLSFSERGVVVKTITAR